MLTLSVRLARASHQASLTKAELACQAGTAKAMGAFTVARAKCLISCQQDARQGTVPASDCLPGAYGGGTRVCVEAAADKAAATELQSCTSDCPACYDGDGVCAPGDCACDAPELAEEVADAIDLYAAVAYCVDPDGLTEAEARCQDNATKTLSRFVVKHLACFRKCHDREHKEKIPAGSCAPLSDAQTIACVAWVDQKTAGAIDKVCPTESRPSCYPPNGASWTLLIGSVVDGYDPEFFCASPSGAFL